jgi:hypothetical protein
MLGSIFLGRIMKSGGVKEQPVRFRFQCASKPCLFVMTLLFSPSFLRFLLPQDLLHNCSRACLPGGIPVRHGDVSQGTQCYFHNTGSGCLQEQGCQINQRSFCHMNTVASLGNANCNIEVSNWPLGSSNSYYFQTVTHRSSTNMGW